MLKESKMAKQVWKGVSCYGGAAYDKKTKKNFFRSYPDDLKNPAIALLHGSFGPAFPMAKEFCARNADKKHLVFYIISNECSRRTGRQGKQICPELNVKAYNAALIAKDARVLRAIGKRVDLVLTKMAAVMNDNSVLWLQTGLEHNLSIEAAQVLAQTVKQAVLEFYKGNKAFAATHKIVNNPMTQTARIGKFLVERHGRDGDRCDVWSFDGCHVGAHDDKNMPDISYVNALGQIKKYKGQYKVVFVFSAYAQGWKNQSAQPYPGREHVISEEEVEGFKMVLSNI